jgi:hypothetical protein
MASTVEKLTQTLLTCLSTASTLCSEIKNNRHCGSTHTQLDLLEISLSDGSSMISARCAGLEGMVVDGRYFSSLLWVWAMNERGEETEAALIRTKHRGNQKGVRSV